MNDVKTFEEIIRMCHGDKFTAVLFDGGTRDFILTGTPNVNAVTNDTIIYRYVSFDASAVDLPTDNVKFYYNEKYPNYGPKIKKEQAKG